MNKLAVITGATGGIGGAIAEALCGHDYHVCLVGRDTEKLAAKQRELQSQYNNCVIHTVCCDILDPLQRQSLVSSVMALPETLTLWINNAGINQFGLLEDQTDEVVSNQLAVNATAPMLLTKAVINAVDHTRPLQIINIGSTFGTIGYAGFVAYSASKFALRGVSEALDRELADTQIDVRYFAPRATQTALNSLDVIDMNRALKVAMDEPAVVAKAFMRFLEGGRRVWYVGFPEKFFARLNSLLPNVVSKALKKQLPVIKSFASQKHPRS